MIKESEYTLECETSTLTQQIASHTGWKEIGSAGNKPGKMSLIFLMLIIQFWLFFFFFPSNFLFSLLGSRCPRLTFYSQLLISLPWWEVATFCQCGTFCVGDSTEELWWMLLVLIIVFLNYSTRSKTLSGEKRRRRIISMWQADIALPTLYQLYQHNEAPGRPHCGLPVLERSI